MVKKIIIPLVIVGVFYGFLYFWNKEEKSAEQHPTIHSPAAKPDDYLLEAKDYEDKHQHDKSASSIEQAIQAIWKLEKDVDNKSFEHLEQTIEKLEIVHRRIIRDSIPSRELLAALEYALGNLAYTELEVAEKYSESNQTSEARAALKYAQLHIKNALILHNPTFAEDSIQLASEVQLLNEIDSLLKEKNLSQPEYTASLDKMISEVDEIIDRMEEKQNLN